MRSSYIKRIVIGSRRSHNLGRDYCVRLAVWARRTIRRTKMLKSQFSICWLRYEFVTSFFQELMRKPRLGTIKYEHVCSGT